MCLHCSDLNHLIDHISILFKVNFQYYSFFAVTTSWVHFDFSWQHLFILYTEQIISNSWTFLVHYHCLDFKNCPFYRVSCCLLNTACWPHMSPSPTQTAVFQATRRAPSPASSCKPQTDCSTPLEGSCVQFGHYLHRRWRGKSLSEPLSPSTNGASQSSVFFTSKDWHSSN